MVSFLCDNVRCEAVRPAAHCRFSEPITVGRAGYMFDQGEFSPRKFYQTHLKSAHISMILTYLKCLGVYHHRILSELDTQVRKDPEKTRNGIFTFSCASAWSVTSSVHRMSPEYEEVVLKLQEWCRLYDDSSR